MSRAGQKAVPRTRTSRRKKQAEATYRQALAVWRSLGERAWVADTLVRLSILEKQRGELAEATRDLEAALALWRELKGEPAGARGSRRWEWLGALSSMETQETTQEAR